MSETIHEPSPGQAKREAIAPPGYKWVTNQRLYRFLDVEEARLQQDFLEKLSRNNEISLLKAFDHDGNQMPQMEAVYAKPKQVTQIGEISP